MSQQPIDRRQVTKALIDARAGALVVTGLGSPTYDVHAAGDDPANYYLWGAMGGAALVGLGLAQAQPDRRIMVITGDGEQLMALGALATIATAAVSNLDIIVLDNEHYGETGMQQSHTARGIDLAAVAAACGFARSRLVTDRSEIGPLCVELLEPATGPRFYTIKVSADELPRSMPSRDAVFIKNRLRAHLGLEPN
jgi:thiamine pyrophosphate-dependent acetolactate synthase large subunit-like protein